MNELYSNEINQLEYKIHVKGVTVDPVELPIARIYISDSNSFTNSEPLTVAEMDGTYQVAVPSSIIENHRFAKVEFEYDLLAYGHQKETETYEISRRLVSFDEVNTYRGRDKVGDSYSIECWQYDLVESIVRLVVEEYCNQKFNYWHGTKVVYGAANSISLDQHLSKFETLTSGLAYNEYFDSTGMDSYEISDSGLSLGNKSQWIRSNVYSRNVPFNSWFNVTGWWGYESVPRPVKEAALELIRYFISDDIEFRRKYFLNMNTAAHSSYTFNFSAYRDSTGNPIADALLSPYRVFNISAV